jgi:hypothetical protein
VSIRFPLRRDKGVFASHFQIAVTGDLRRLDGATANLLPPRNVRPPVRVRHGARPLFSRKKGRYFQQIFSLVDSNYFRLPFSPSQKGDMRNPEMY